MKQVERSGIPWPVFAVTVAAAFMVALDLSIVNIAFPSIRQALERYQALGPGQVLI